MDWLLLARKTARRTPFTALAAELLEERRVLAAAPAVSAVLPGNPLERDLAVLLGNLVAQTSAATGSNQGSSAGTLAGGTLRINGPYYGSGTVTFGRLNNSISLNQLVTSSWPDVRATNLQVVGSSTFRPGHAVTVQFNVMKTQPISVQGSLIIGNPYYPFLALQPSFNSLQPLSLYPSGAVVIVQTGSQTGLVNTATAPSAPTASQGPTITNTATGASAPTSSLKVQVYLSADSSIGTNDRLLGTVDVSNPDGAWSQSIDTAFTLPDADDPFWAHLEKYHLGLIVDSTGAVAESNEANNANQGLGVDIAAINVDWSIDLTALPATGFKTGDLAKEFFYRERLYLNDVYNALGKAQQAFAAAGAKTVAQARAWINALRGELQSLENAIAAIGSGRARAIALGDGLALDARQVDLFERFLLYELRHGFGAAGAASSVRSLLGTVTALSNAGFKNAATASVVATNAAADSLTSLSGAAAGLARALDAKKIYGDVGKLLQTALDVSVRSGQTAGAAFLAKTTALAAVAGRQLNALYDAVLRGDPNRVAQIVDSLRKDASLKTAVQQVVDLGGVNKAGGAVAGQLRKLTADAAKIASAVEPLATFVTAQFAEAYASLRSRIVADKSWAGLTAIRVNGKTYYGANTVRFQSVAGGLQIGTLTVSEFDVDGAGKVTNVRRVGYSFRGTWTAENRFVGVIRLRDAAGKWFDRAISWKFDGTYLYGSVSAGAAIGFYVTG